MNLFKVLFISWSIGAGLPYLNELDISYELKCVSMSLIYFIFAVICYHYIELELRLKNNLNVYLISAICFCMVITSWFNFLFVNTELYYLLLDMRRGDGLSWKNIYKSVELIALLTVGRNGTIYLYNWTICRYRWINVIIANNSTYNLGR